MAVYEDILVPPDWLSPEPAAAPPAPAIAAPAPTAPPVEGAPPDWVPADWIMAEGAPATPDELAAAPLDGIDPAAAPGAGAGGGAPAPGVPAPAGQGEAPELPTVAGAPEEGQDVAGEPIFPWQIESLDAARAGEEPAEYDFTDREAEDAEVARILAGGEEAAAEEGARREASREQHIATRRIEEDTANRQRAERNANEWRTREAEYREERAAVARETMELAKKGIDNSNWFSSAGPARTISAFVTGIVGGLLAPNNGGRNSGIEFIERQVEQDIATQKANMAHQRDMLGMRRGLLADLTAANGDAFRAEEAMRMAIWENVDQRLAAEAAKFDPMGTRAQKIADARMAVREKMAKKKAEADELAFDRKVKEHQMRIARGQLAEQRASRKAQAAEQLADRTLRAKEKGFIYDAQGNLVTDPDAARAAMSPQDQLAALRGQKLEKEMTAEARGRLITFRGKTIGMAKTETEAKELRARQGYYDMYQKELTELANMVSNPDGTAKTFYQGPGWKLGENKERDAVGAKARKLLYLEAKINDPNSAVREAEIEFGKEIVPYIQGFTEAGVNPRAKVEQLLHSADTALDADYDAKLDPEETQRVLGGSIDRAVTPVGTWKAARKAGAEMRQGAAAATEEQSMDMLLAKAAPGTPPEAVAEFVAQKAQVLDRWATDQPWMFEGLNAKNIVARWESDPTLTSEQKAGLKAALQDAATRARNRALDTARAPRRAPHQPNRPDLYPEFGDDEE